jgi:transcriptional regulator with XRE-family HTH domain
MATDENARNPQPARLAQAIRDASQKRGWLQEDLILHSGLGRSTIQRLWSGRSPVTPTRRTKTELERTFEWDRGTVEALWFGESPPEPRRDASDDLTVGQLRELARELIARADRLEARQEERRRSA